MMMIDDITILRIAVTTVNYNICEFLALVYFFVTVQPLKLGF